jgi:hypothetical protein
VTPLGGATIQDEVMAKLLVQERRVDEDKELSMQIISVVMNAQGKGIHNEINKQIGE